MQDLISEKNFYSRHFNLPLFNEETQQKLRSARILVIGVGGLGCPAVTYLAGAGVGKIALCDADTVSVTNLHRQTLFDTTCIGQKKVEVAAKRLRSINPYIVVEEIDQFANNELLTNIIPKYDLVLDATDNFITKYTLNDICETFNIPLIYGSIYQFEGQISVFHYPTLEYPKGFSYRDIYPEAPPSGLTQNCGEAGVIGVLPGIIGAMQANEAIKVITGLGEPLAGKLLIFDALTTTSKRLILSKKNKTSIQQNCNNEINYDELQKRLLSNNPPFLIDVRELIEREERSIGGEHIPIDLLPKHIQSLPVERELILYCKSGLRSAKAVLYLRSIFPNATILSLKGGIDICDISSTNCAL
ncbi:HesA/MoeB/ThiF family protein [Acinetobacter seifertii]|uniref:HesA/MoeB/ThiF family protein n=1 Tax=Acinetobacter seifertii TaxID=1530123 RepID=UPI000D3A7051|nr:HesA/MoeB/ThiF family protein [Acinetobacter seifertii]PTV52737.1 molybdenum cofactor biosynthesis protein MoeB [Acinetobacter seifertii]